MDINWLDKERYTRCRLILKEYIGSLFYSHLLGITLGNMDVSISKKFMCTGLFDTKESALKTQLNIVKKVKDWYDIDIFDKDSKAYLSLKETNSTHRKVFNSNSEFVKSMELGQIFIIYFTIVHPNKLGFNVKYMNEYIYFWKVIFSSLGISENDNICNSESYSEVYKKCMMIYDDNFKNKQENLTEVTMNKVGMTLGVTCEEFLLNYKVIFSHLQQLCEVKNKYYKLSLKDNIMLRLINFATSTLWKYWIFRKMLNRFVYFKLND